MPDARYPVGKFVPEENLTEARCTELIAQIAEAPGKLRSALKGLDDKQLDTPYRDGGWTVRQVAHHLPDSHLNAYVRFKLAMTEDFPAVKTYEEKLWAQTADTKLPVEPSVVLLEALHQRWVALLKGMSAADYQRKLKHPELGEVTLERYLGLYAWHGRHHVAHIQSLRERMKWNDEPVYIGEFKKDAGLHNGWFVGSFIESGPRRTDKLELKYWEFDKDVNHPEKTSGTLECTLILEGEITGLISGKMESLHGGQYVVISPGVPNGFPKAVHKKVVGLTIKAPSDPSAKKLTGRD